MALPSQYSRHFFVEESNNNSWSNMYRYVPEGARVLDVGCSTGNFGEALKDLKQCTVVGIDISEADVDIARTKLSEAYVLDITAPDVADQLGRFDVVVFADVLEHLPDPRGALRAVHALLADGGFIIYSIPHMGHHSVRMDLLEGRFPYTELGLLDRTHLHYYDRFEVHDIFAQGGFAIVNENPTLSGNTEKWTTDRLATLGLTPSPLFFEMLKKTDADIFQFVGMAVPGTDAPVLPTGAREETAPPDLLLNHANNVIAENELLTAEIAGLRAHIAELETRSVRQVLRAAKHQVQRRS